LLKNYIKVAIRNLLRSKVYSFINIAGLAAGMCCSILILLWVQDELNFNLFHQDIDNLYIVPQNQFYAGGRRFSVYNSPAPLGPALKAEYPEVVYSARFDPYLGEMLVQRGDNSFVEKVQYADADFFRMFTFSFSSGNKNNAFPQVHSVVLTKKIAAKYFGSQDPVGKTLRFNSKYDFTVSGVVSEVPQNSDIQFDIILPFEFIKELGDGLDQWFNNNYWTFVKLKPNINWQDFSLKIKDRLKKEGTDVKNELFLFPVKDMHLYSISEDEPGQIKRVRLFTIIAFVILLIACINFMNLATARSAKRSKEVGLRKVVGANRSQLIKQFFSESIVITFFALFLALLLVELLLPGFNELSGKELEVHYFSGGFLLLLALITIVTGVIAGSYPALFLSSFSPVKVLKENLNTGTKGALLRRVLVVVQFSLSIILIVSTIVVYTQLNYMKTRDTGYNSENTFYIPAKGTLIDKFEIFRDRLLKDKNVRNVSISSHRPSFSGTNGGGFEWEGKNPDEDVLITLMTVDDNYASTFNLKLAAGRFFSGQIPSDTVDAVVINETLAKLMKKESAVGSLITRGEEKYKVIGVLKDYHFNPVKYAIEPMIMWDSKFWANYIFVKVDGRNTTEAIDFVKQVNAEINPDYPFNYTFLDEEYDTIFKNEERLGRLYNYFSVLAIMISCLGLFGLASFMAEQRKKEIGVRKVLGSSVLQIVYLLSKSFTSLVLIANIIAWPLAYFFMKDWLEDFAYRINLNPVYFIISGLAALTVALTAVSYQAFKAARTNPVNTIKYE
jgi:ABC-type antimicrobial peptide transport system permease subunit